MLHNVIIYLENTERIYNKLEKKIERPSKLLYEAVADIHNYVADCFINENFCRWMFPEVVEFLYKEVESVNKENIKELLSKLIKNKYNFFKSNILENIRLGERELKESTPAEVVYEIFGYLDPKKLEHLENQLQNRNEGKTSLTQNGNKGKSGNENEEEKVLTTEGFVKKSVLEKAKAAIGEEPDNKNKKPTSYEEKAEKLAKVVKMIEEEQKAVGVDPCKWMREILRQNVRKERFYDVMERYID